MTFNRECKSLLGFLTIIADWEWPKSDYKLRSNAEDECNASCWVTRNENIKHFEYVRFAQGLKSACYMAKKYWI